MIHSISSFPAASLTATEMLAWRTSMSIYFLLPKGCVLQPAAGQFALHPDFFAQLDSGGIDLHLRRFRVIHVVTAVITATRRLHDHTDYRRNRHRPGD